MLWWAQLHPRGMHAWDAAQQPSFACGWAARLVCRMAASTGPPAGSFPAAEAPHPQTLEDRPCSCAAPGTPAHPAPHAAAGLERSYRGSAPPRMVPVTSGCTHCAHGFARPQSALRALHAARPALHGSQCSPGLGPRGAGPGLGRRAREERRVQPVQLLQAGVAGQVVHVVRPAGGGEGV
jgi:hypothetical protein